MVYSVSLSVGTSSGFSAIAIPQLMTDESFGTEYSWFGRYRTPLRNNLLISSYELIIKGVMFH